MNHVADTIYTYLLADPKRRFKIDDYSDVHYVGPNGEWYCWSDATSPFHEFVKRYCINRD